MELLWEMAAKRKGEKIQQRVVVVLEIVKAICRLLLLRLINSPPLVSPPLAERDVGLCLAEEMLSQDEGSRKSKKVSTRTDCETRHRGSRHRTVVS